jgi:hypothetical protein
MAGQRPPAPGHAMPTKHTAAPKSKMRNMGHGVYMDSKGKYHSKDGKFMSKAAADKALGHGVKKPGPMRDAHGRFMKKPTSPPTKKPSMMSKTKAKLHPKKKP